MAKLQVQARELVGKKVKNLRAEGQIPAAMFGPKFESASILVDEKAFREVFKEAGHSALVDVETDGGKKEKVLFREVQIHPVTDEILHVAMYVIDPTKELNTEIPLEFSGVSPAEENGIGFVAYSMDSIEIRCLAKDLPISLPVDVSVLLEAGDSILVGDVKLPEGVELDYGMDEGAPVAYLATAQKIEDVLEEIAEGQEAAETEEGEEGVEGEEGAEGGEGDSDSEAESGDE